MKIHLDSFTLSSVIVGLLTKKHTRVIRTIGMIFGAVLFLGATPYASAQEYPNKPITLIVPWGAGGNSDIAGRLLADKMRDRLGQPVIVMNMPGAGSLIGARALVNSKPDGYTLGWFGISAVTGQYIFRDPVAMDQYMPVSGILNPSFVFWVNSKSPLRTLRDFVEYAKKNPGKIKNGNAGSGSIDHLYSVQFAMLAGIEMTQVPYRGSGQALVDLAGGHLDSVLAALGPAKPMETTGQIRAIAIGSDTRHPLRPDVPTIKEGGVNMTMPFWESVAVPLGTPSNIVAILDKAIREAFDDPDFQKKNMDTVAMSYMGGTKEIAKLRMETNETIRRLVEALGLKP